MTQLDSSTSGIQQPAAAPASLVNRTHRTVRARAQVLQANRRRVRSLWLPLLVSSSMLLIVCYAIWSMFDEYEITPTGIPDASNQFFVLLVWFLPVTMAVLGMVWFRRTRNRAREDVYR